MTIQNPIEVGIITVVILIALAAILETCREQIYSNYGNIRAGLSDWD